ncbi:TonB family protein [Massilia sp. PAMC28688]|uniref:energy transducer TonB n=1 Tax=Massilia sp. PAMC28688 TaxID=2861283 RepID=UPI001C6302D5|nr:energy transducer TonB [Massilia sp. PAMC28688]QYF94908.1 TonB family protein [Massilia sp. PAMC28688]
MHFSHTGDGTGSKFTKVAIVSALHVALGAALIHNMDSKVFTMPKAMEEIVLFTPEAPKPPPPPPEPPKPKPRTAPAPKVFTPPVEVDVPMEQIVEAPIQTTSEPSPEVTEPGPVTPDAPPAQASNNRGEMFSAALANADACDKPDYPARAAREGVTGTVELALLIGPDGRVTDSRVQRSSGSRDLDRAAQSALSLCQFKPAMQAGVPQAAWGQIAYVWTLD